MVIRAKACLGLQSAALLPLAHHSIVEIAAFGGALPALPGGVGTFEAAFGGAVALLSGDESTALAVAITGRLYNYLNSIVIGGIGLLREGQTLSGVYTQLKALRSKPVEEMNQ